MTKYRIRTLLKNNGLIPPPDYNITNLLKNLDGTFKTTTDNINDAYYFCDQLLIHRHAQELEVEEVKCNM